MDKLSQNQSSCLNSKILTDIRLLLGEDADDFIPDLITDYLQSSQDLLNNLESSIESKDNDKIQINAHTLGSSSATLGAMNLAKYCHQMELVARNGKDGKYETLWKKINGEYSQVVDVLTNMLHKNKIN